MRKWIWASLLALPLVTAGGLIYGQTRVQGPAGQDNAGTDAQGYLCPLTGEVLPCRLCCPLCCDCQQSTK